MQNAWKCEQLHYYRWYLLSAEHSNRRLSYWICRECHVNNVCLINPFALSIRTCCRAQKNFHCLKRNFIFGWIVHELVWILRHSFLFVWTMYFCVPFHVWCTNAFYGIIGAQSVHIGRSHLFTEIHVGNAWKLHYVNGMPQITWFMSSYLLCNRIDVISICPKMFQSIWLRFSFFFRFFCSQLSFTDFEYVPISSKM